MQHAWKIANIFEVVFLTRYFEYIRLSKKKDTGIDDKFLVYLVSNANIDKNAAIYSQHCFLALFFKKSPNSGALFRSITCSKLRN